MTTPTIQLSDDQVRVLKFLAERKYREDGFGTPRLPEADSDIAYELSGLQLLSLTKYGDFTLTPAGKSYLSSLVSEEQGEPKAADDQRSGVCDDCGGTMLKWNGSIVYRDAPNVTEWRCVKCGNKQPLKRPVASPPQTEGAQWFGLWSVTEEKPDGFWICATDDDGSILAYESLKAAEHGAKHQADLYEVESVPKPLTWGKPEAEVPSSQPPVISAQSDSPPSVEGREFAERIVRRWDDGGPNGGHYCGVAIYDLDGHELISTEIDAEPHHTADVLARTRLALAAHFDKATAGIKARFAQLQLDYRDEFNRCRKLSSELEALKARHDPILQENFRLRDACRLAHDELTLSAPACSPDRQEVVRRVIEKCREVLK